MLRMLLLQLLVLLLLVLPVVLLHGDRGVGGGVGGVFCGGSGADFASVAVVTVSCFGTVVVLRGSY